MSDNPLCKLFGKLKNNSETVEGILEELGEELAQYIYLIDEFNDEDLNLLEGKRGRQFRETYTNFFGLFKQGLEKKKQEKARLKHFEIMQKCRKNHDFVRKCSKMDCKSSAFKEVLLCLHSIRKFTEKSFGAKLLSMMNPAVCPPWDSNVETVLKPHLPSLGNSKRKKLPGSKDFDGWNTFYMKLCVWYEEFVNEDIKKKTGWINQFYQWFDNQWYPWYEQKILNAQKDELNDGIIKPVCLTKSYKKYSIKDIIKPVKIIDLLLWQKGRQEKRLIRQKKRQNKQT